jgi:hypothetical protein
MFTWRPRRPFLLECGTSDKHHIKVGYIFHLTSRNWFGIPSEQTVWACWCKNNPYLSFVRRINTCGHVHSDSVFGVTGFKLEEVDTPALTLRLAEEQLAMNCCPDNVISCSCRADVQRRT